MAEALNPPPSPTEVLDAAVAAAAAARANSTPEDHHIHAPNVFIVDLERFQLS